MDVVDRLVITLNYKSSTIEVLVELFDAVHYPKQFSFNRGIL